MDRSLVQYMSLLLCCSNHLSSASSTSLRSDFRNRSILNPFCSKAPIILFLFLQIFWIVEFTRPNFRHTPTFFFPYSVSRMTLNIHSTLKNNFFPTLATLLLHQSPVNCRSWKVEGKGKLYARSELLLGSSPFWDVTQRRLVVTVVSRQPVRPI